MSIEFLEVDNIPANAVRDLMIDAVTGEADSRFIEEASEVTLAILANAVGIELSITSGKRVIVARSTLDASGTTGQFPNINEKAFSWLAAAGEKTRIQLRELTGVATTDVMGAISVEPL